MIQNDLLGILCGDFIPKPLSIYQSKDILLQSKALEANFIIAEKTTSTYTKTLVYIMILIVAFTPLYQLFGIAHFV
jgi:hypothetical protein